MSILDLPLAAKARIELALQAAEQAFGVVSGDAVVVTKDFSRRVIPMGPQPVGHIPVLGLEYPADQAAVQFVVDVFESVVQVFGETAQAHSWSADVFRSSMESWCDGLTDGRTD